MPLPQEIDKLHRVVREHTFDQTPTKNTKLNIVGRSKVETELLELTITIEVRNQSTRKRF